MDPMGYKLLLIPLTYMGMDQYLLINTIFRGMNIHLPAILGFTRYQGFDPSPYSINVIITNSIIGLLKAPTELYRTGPPPRGNLQKFMEKHGNIWNNSFFKNGKYNL